jgi:PHD/YefM family antitoxin component YafN of YafNO toxin-antitoxin module
MATPGLNPDTRSAPAPERKASAYLRQLKEAGQPVVLTVNGQAELVVQGAGSYQQLIELAERAEEIESVRVAIEEMKAGKGIPAEEVFAEMRQILAEARAKPEKKAR